jgi:hypothetical protein
VIEGIEAADQQGVEGRLEAEGVEAGDRKGSLGPSVALVMEVDRLDHPARLGRRQVDQRCHPPGR